MAAIKNVSAAIIKELVGAQFKPQEAVWVADETLLSVPSGSWDYSTKDLKTWTVHEASFNVKGVDDPLVFRFRNGQKPDADGDIAIVRFVAKSDFNCTNGKVIKKGDKAIFAVME